MLALSVGTVFTAPGSDHSAVDPTSLDPGRRRDGGRGHLGAST